MRDEAQGERRDGQRKDWREGISRWRKGEGGEKKGLEGSMRKKLENYIKM